MVISQENNFTHTATASDIRSAIRTGHENDTWTLFTLHGTYTFIVPMAGELLQNCYIHDQYNEFIGALFEAIDDGTYATIWFNSADDSYNGFYFVKSIH